MISTHDGTGVILLVDSFVDDRRTGTRAVTTSIYTAGPRHLLFSLSLPQAFKAPNGNSVDFTRIEGLPVSAKGLSVWV